MFMFIAGRGCGAAAVLKFPFIAEFDPIIDWAMLMPLVIDAFIELGLISPLPIVIDGGFIIGPMLPPFIDIELPIAMFIIELPIPWFVKEPFIVAEPI